MGARNYRDLIVWQKAMDLVEALYRVSARFPREELYGLSSQLRAAAVSTASNIAEGQGRGSPTDFCRFLNMSLGSLHEAETQVLIAGRLRYVEPKTVESILTRTAEVGRLIHGLIKTLRRREP